MPDQDTQTILDKVTTPADQAHDASPEDLRSALTWALGYIKSKAEAYDQITKAQQQSDDGTFVLMYADQIVGSGRTSRGSISKHAAYIVGNELLTEGRPVYVLQALDRFDLVDASPNLGLEPGTRVVGRKTVTQEDEYIFGDPDALDVA